MFVTTHVNDPLPAAVALKVLEVIKRDQLIDRSKILSARLLRGLQNLMQKHQCIGDVRGRGLLLGVEFIPHGGQSATAITSKVTDTALELGVSANITGAYSAGTMRLRSEEHTSELQSLMRISYAVFCLKKKKIT